MYAIASELLPACIGRYRETERAAANLGEVVAMVLE
jgi:hypothetical protein